MTFFSNKEFKNYIFIICGSLFLSAGLVGFFLPNQLLTGGTAGLSLLLHYITSYSVGVLMVAVNIPLLIIGGKYLGKMFALRTIITILLISVFIEFFTEVVELRAFISDTILATIFGGICIGIGLALVIKGNSSAGGSTIVARIVSSKTEIKPGQVILIIDSLIIFSSLFVFDDTAKVLWSIVSIYITAKVIDVILTGSLNKKVIYLVSSKAHELKVLIRERLGPDGTILKGEGLFEGQEKEMILVVVEVTKLQLLREIVREHDPDAFLIIYEATEMIGREC
ncbi:MAG: YitT family protein [Campylobacteraceae bacterium]|nr:YitT family protein [Campylobacteraceae bacterium]